MQVQPRGSFGKPETEDRPIPKTKGSFGRPDQQPLMDPPPKMETKIEDPVVEKTAQEKDEEELIKDLQKDLGITIDEDDVWGVLMGNTLEKRQIEIFPGRIYATFRTLNMKDSRYVGERLAEATDKKILDLEFNAIRIHHTLAAGVLEMGKPGKVNSLGETVEERFKSLDVMSTLVVDKLSKKWGSFTLLIELILKRDITQGK